ncbi:hypothetical protein AAGG74_16480 [Bacillus mexicanus]|uniref:hypothetical protein n=1 Tax=Bacillus mexicanus TaxID=2834415 RepID=UPI003D1FE159
MANKNVEINTVYMNFSFRNAAYCFYSHNYVCGGFACSYTGLMMGYVNFAKAKRLLSDTEIQKIKIDPFTGQKYIPLKKVKRIPLWPYTYEQSEFKYKMNQSICFKEFDKDIVRPDYLDEEFFFALLESKGLDVSEVRWYYE